MKLNVYDLDDNFLYEGWLKGNTIEEALDDGISTSWCEIGHKYCVVWQGVLMSIFVLTEKLKLEVDVFFNTEEEYRNDYFNERR